MTQLLLLLASVVAIAGIFNLTPATTGVGLVALACLMAIYARIMQASAVEDRSFTALAIFLPVGILAVIGVLAFVQMQTADIPLPGLPR